MATLVEARTFPTLTPFALALRKALKDGGSRRVARFRAGGLGVEVRATGDSLWALVRREGEGGFALRLVFVPEGAFDCSLHEARPGEAARLQVQSVFGMHDVVLASGGEGLEYLRVTICLTPATPLLIPHLSKPVATWMRPPPRGRAPT